ncbi:MAG: 3-deoxy-D-manno-octulosonic acid transferase [Ferrovum myxofaciens]|jgi:3-deoxy-D-manno-octulosonic-acid transferase|uniref:3-deoxy-D-manno-octulosonic acid transferase n=1 Tax=Ferrovum myxofaciens TaxID=416213 RepID=UPI001D32111D|nr:3-deoxy-D-manno-octulosonic acid transferase [Ferrovum myxofaciens]MBW8028583.1 glycosyltransferase [Ferrovum sp.]QKE41346.1 MAG: 3-deoxy-D-manno-octulosonic acid transferase [Ferrovum myxofaciens]
MNLFWYTQLTRLILPLFFLRLWWRGRQQPGYRLHWLERLGHYSISESRPLIWLHAVSVGETRAALPLLRSLAEQYPNHAFLLTHTTPTGRETALDEAPPGIQRVYLPYDLPGAVGRFLETFKPTLGFLLETELWPRLIHECHHHHIPLILANARLSERSARRYALVPTLTRTLLGQLSLIAAQSHADAQRFEALGAPRVKLMGNLKFDAPLPCEHHASFQPIRQMIGENRTVWIAASTREGEESLLLKHLGSLLTPPHLLVLVPRHPQRFDAVAALLEARHIPYQRRSAQRPLSAETTVLLGDSMGEMYAWYRLAQYALMGGTLLPLGGQNLLEALSVGCPVLLGPYTFNFAEASTAAVECGAARQFSNLDELPLLIKEFLENPTLCHSMGEQGRCFVERNRGATATLLDLVRELVH